MSDRKSTPAGHTLRSYAEELLDRWPTANATHRETWAVKEYAQRLKNKVEELETLKETPSQSPLICATKHKHGYRITFHNGVYLGDAEPDIDGYYKFWPNNRAGYWESTSLRDISDFLEHLNAEWDEQVQKECGG